MEFEFDPKKSEQNKAEHGIDFIEAQVRKGAKGVRRRPDRERIYAVNAQALGFTL